VAHRIQRKETFRGLIFFEIVDLAADGTEVLLLEGGEAPRVTDLYLRRTDGSPAVRLGEGDWGGRSREIANPFRRRPRSKHMHKRRFFPMESMLFLPAVTAKTGVSIRRT
jgi:hypothetical protein